MLDFGLFDSLWLIIFVGGEAVKTFQLPVLTCLAGFLGFILLVPLAAALSATIAGTEPKKKGVE